ncbi:hypothetical protein Vafri_12471 [Volvox africanus]|uniref:Secreted protein n=1 Tax=Volvox africanus TaxID=51714 RepID=A0A8J4F4F2_9CHLO|nr:hypothetical protein Vafri_12471 [Volvox africanus]
MAGAAGQAAGAAAVAAVMLSALQTPPACTEPAAVPLPPPPSSLPLPRRTSSARMRPSTRACRNFKAFSADSETTTQLSSTLLTRRRRGTAAAACSRLVSQFTTIAGPGASAMTCGSVAASC